MDHKQEKDLHKKKEREQDNKDEKEREKAQERQNFRIMHPVWYFVLGTILILMIVLLWTFLF